MEVNKEIEEMLKGLGDPTPDSLKQDEEEKEKEEVIEEKKEEKEEEKSEEKIEEEEEKEEDSESEEIDKDKVIESLRQQLNERQALKEKKEESEEKGEKKEESLKLEETDFIGDLDLDDLTRDKDMFNKLLNAVYSKGVSDSKKIATEGVLMSIPDIVKHNVALVTSLTETRKKFYDENKDLSAYEGVVAVVFEELAAKNPDKIYSEILKDVGPEVRRRLGLQKDAKEMERRESSKAPRLPNSKGGPRSPGNKPETSALAKELEEMNKHLGR